MVTSGLGYKVGAITVNLTRVFTIVLYSQYILNESNTPVIKVYIDSPNFVQSNLYYPLQVLKVSIKPILWDILRFKVKNHKT